MSRQNLQFTAKDAALRDDVRELGELVGDVLRDQGGDLLFGLVEQDRQTAIRWREGDAEAAVDLAIRTQGRDASVARDLVRAFSTWFQVVNLAEKVHRIRRRREYLNRSDRPQPGGIADCFFRLRTLGVTQEQLLEQLQGLVIYPVLTAHPMESTRRTILRKQQRIAQLMIERLNPTLTPAERRVTWENIRGEVTSGWQTEDLPRTRLTVADEREHVLFYLAEVIYRIVPPLYEEIEIALEQVYGIPVGSVAIPCVLRFGSWVGGDMDGNPDVHAKTIRETLHRQQQVIISTYYDECLGLARKLSQSDSRIDISRRLQARIGEYTTILPRAQPAMAARHDRMPYRTFMGQVAERLRTTYDGRPNHYENVGQFIADIELVAESLRENHGRHAGLFHVERLIRRARTFGFHLATLDVRQHADVHRAVVGQGMGDADWPQRDRAERARILAEAVTSDRGPTGPLGPVGRRTLAVFEAMVQARHRFGARAVGDYVVSGCEGVDDMLSVLLLARWADVTDKKTGQVPIDVVPLFETVVALEGCADTFRALNAEPAYRSHAEARGRRQTVMIGYADTNKESGIAAARFAVHQAQASLVAAARELGTGLCIFHGRSAAIGRGGRTESLVRGAPPGAVHGELRVSEQGEVIHNSYGLRAIAMRTFEQAVHSVMLYTATAASRKPADARFVDAMGCMARASRARYRDLIYGTPGFYGFFREVTPIDVIERMQLGSRPAHRPEQTGLAALRTVPWLFAWTQSRHLLPGWFGVGTGLEAIAREHGPEVIARMHAEWPFFAGLLADVEFQLAKGDRGVFEHYHALAPAALANYADEILAEHALAIRWITWAKGEVDLMDSDPVLQRTVLLRTPYLDPMHLMQIDLLRRWRASGREDEALFRALIASVSGIAQGLQAAG